MLASVPRECSSVRSFRVRRRLACRCGSCCDPSILGELATFRFLGRDGDCPTSRSRPLAEPGVRTWSISISVPSSRYGCARPFALPATPVRRLGASTVNLRRTTRSEHPPCTTTSTKIHGARHPDAGQALLAAQMAGTAYLDDGTLIEIDQVPYPWLRTGRLLLVGQSPSRSRNRKVASSPRIEGSQQDPQRQASRRRTRKLLTDEHSRGTAQHQRLSKLIAPSSRTHLSPHRTDRTK